jgi:hypothetical protein
MMKKPLGLSRVLKTSGKDSLIQSVPAALEVFSKGMITSSRLTRAGPGCCWAEEGTAKTARSSNERTIPAGFLKISKL